MRGFFNARALSALGLLFLTNVAHSENVLQKCFPNTDFSKSKVECVLSTVNGDLRFTLARGEVLSVSGLSKYGEKNKDIKVERISHLPPRLSEAGPMDESIRFLGRSTMGTYQATMDFACNKTFFALVGFDKTSDNEMPREHTAACRVDSI